MRGTLKLVLKIEGALLELAPLSVSPAEPTAEIPVELDEPHVAGGLLPAAPRTYRWMVGDGTTSTEPSPKHTYPASAKSVTASYEVSAGVIVSNFAHDVIAAGTRS